MIVEGRTELEREREGASIGGKVRGDGGNDGQECGVEKWKACMYIGGDEGDVER